MNFYINQNSEEPSLKLKLIDDAIFDKSKFNDMLVDASITLDLYDTKSGNPILLDSKCSVVASQTKFNFTDNNYIILHKFNKKTTKNLGIFEGKVTIKYTDSDDGERTLILPLHEKLFVNVI